ncbi:MAG: hypothetical protein R2691_12890 [Solirubrobacterales bacterium]
MSGAGRACGRVVIARQQAEGLAAGERRYGLKVVLVEGGNASPRALARSAGRAKTLFARDLIATEPAA